MSLEHLKTVAPVQSEDRAKHRQSKGIFKKMSFSKLWNIKLIETPVIIAPPKEKRNKIMDLMKTMNTRG